MILTIARCPYCAQVIAVDFQRLALIFDPDRAKSRPCKHLVALNGFIARPGQKHPTCGDGFDWFLCDKRWPNWSNDWCPEEIDAKAPMQLATTSNFRFDVRNGKRAESYMPWDELGECVSQDFSVCGAVVFSENPARLLDALHAEY